MRRVVKPSHNPGTSCDLKSFGICRISDFIIMIAVISQKKKKNFYSLMFYSRKAISYVACVKINLKTKGRAREIWGLYLFSSKGYLLVLISCFSLDFSCINTSLVASYYTVILKTSYLVMEWNRREQREWIEKIHIGDVY